MRPPFAPPKCLKCHLLAAGGYWSLCPALAAPLARPKGRDHAYLRTSSWSGSRAASWLIGAVSVKPVSTKSIPFWEKRNGSP